MSVYKTISFFSFYPSFYFLWLCPYVHHTTVSFTRSLVLLLLLLSLFLSLARGALLCSHQTRRGRERERKKRDSLKQSSTAANEHETWRDISFGTSALKKERKKDLDEWTLDHRCCRHRRGSSSFFLLFRASYLAKFSSKLAS